ncbi:hypothetical protein HOY34_13795 [Xinfangfangia sp. D13-10-4-6]|uniref:hypothetical protein n=1 Tax=Pseudogemmobacter hezensis TaxID=2737662 RepID=UPI001552F2CC|nr:hypothetical protein [Pseudogemmobacter hezensis]NPD16268.1 hypothetical protein [Pseudogemmobacter hezensis]
MKSVLFLAAAVALIGLGGYRQFGQSSVSAEDQARCEGIISAEYASSPESVAELAPRCSDPGMVAMMDARASSSSAQEAAQSIAAANQGDYVSTLINCALIGAGIGALGAAFAGRRRAA